MIGELPEGENIPPDLQDDREGEKRRQRGRWG
jgi:hypothetical protein